MRPVEIRIMALVETGIMGPVEAGSGVGCPDFVQSRATHGCVNRRLRRWEWSAMGFVDTVEKWDF